MLRPALRGPAPLALVCAAACAEPEPEPADWAFVPPPEPPEATLTADEVGAAADRLLPALAAVHPADVDGPLDQIAAALEPCGVGALYEDDTYGDSRIWIGDASCERGGVEGFAYQLAGELDPNDPYTPGMTGTYAYTIWSAAAWADDVYVGGNADWGVQDYVVDGIATRFRWFEGDLRVDPADARPAWFVDDVSPSAVTYTSTTPDGKVYTYFDGSTPSHDEAVDALNVLDLTIGPDCTEVAGAMSVHARGGGWYDLTLTDVDVEGACVACGAVTDADGDDLGSACVSLSAVLEGGLP